jgi:hypothetical protein
VQVDVFRCVTEWVLAGQQPIGQMPAFSRGDFLAAAETPTSPLVRTYRASRPQEHRSGGRNVGDALFYCQAPGLVEARFSRSGERRRVGDLVVVGLVLDRWDQAQFAVQSSVVEPVDVLGDGDLDVVDAPPRPLLRIGLAPSRAG